MTPPPARAIAGAAAWMPRKTPQRLTSMMWRKLSGVCWRTPPKVRMPALLKSALMPPNAASASATGRLPVLRRGDVEVAVERRPAEIGGERLALGVEHVGDHDAGATAGEQAGGRGADAAGTAGDDDAKVVGRDQGHAYFLWLGLGWRRGWRAAASPGTEVDQASLVTNGRGSAPLSSAGMPAMGFATPSGPVRAIGPLRKPEHATSDGFHLRHRRPAQCRQVDPLQRPHPHRGGPGGELSLLHDRAEHRRGRGARSAARPRSPRSPSRQNLVPTRISFVDIAGLVRGASKGEGLGNQFLANIREVDAIVHVLRCFEGGDITHVEGRVDPVADAETVNTELMLADLASLERRVTQLRKRAQGGDKEAKAEVGADGRGARGAQRRQAGPRRRHPEGRGEGLRRAQPPTAKPVLYVANVEEASAATGNALSAPGRGDGRGRRRRRRSSSRRRSNPRSPSFPTASSATSSIRSASTSPASTG